MVALAIMGASAIFGFNVLGFEGLRHAEASDAALIMPTMPTLFTIPLAAMLFGERFGRWQWGGLALLLAGEFFVFREAVFSTGISGERLLGIGLFFVAAFLWAVYTVCARFLGGRIGPIHATLYAIAIGLLLLLPVGGWHLAELVRAVPSPGLTANILYLGALQTVLALIWWFEGVQAIGAGKAAVMNTLVPVVALVLAAFFLDDVPTLERVFGAVLVIVGVAAAAAGGNAFQGRGRSVAQGSPT